MNQYPPNNDRPNREYNPNRRYDRPMPPNFPNGQYRMPPQNGRPPQKKQLRIPILLPIVLILVVSVALGFAFEFAASTYERMTHPIRYSDYVDECSERFDVPREVIYAVIRAESGFDPEAVSPKGAVGLMQILPETYEWLTTKTGEEYSPDKLYDPYTNIYYGTFFLDMLRDEFIIWETAYAAYNAGFGRVREWLKDPSYATNGHLTDIPYPETAKYVVRVRDAAEVYGRLIAEMKDNGE